MDKYQEWIKQNKKVWLIVDDIQGHSKLILTLTFGNDKHKVGLWGI